MKLNFKFLKLQNYSKPTKAYIEAIVEELNNRSYLKPNTEGMLLQLAENFEDFITASQALREEGLTIKSSWGTKINPLYQVKKDAQSHIDKLMVELMLTPKMAVRIKEITGQDVNEGECDLLGQFLQLKKEVEND